MNDTDIIDSDLTIEQYAAADLKRIAEKDAESKMLRQIVDADKAQTVEPKKRPDPFRRLNVGYNPIRGRNIGPFRKSRGLPVIYRESAQQSNEPGVVLMDRILVVPRSHRAEPKNDPIAQEKAIAKRNRKARKLEDAVASGGWGAQ